jgi:hypothetical protein
MRSRLLLDVVVRESTAVLEMLAGENKMLLVREDSWSTERKGDEEREEGGVEEE